MEEFVIVWSNRSIYNIFLRLNKIKTSFKNIGIICTNADYCIDLKDLWINYTINLYGHSSETYSKKIILIKQEFLNHFLLFIYFLNTLIIY